MKLSLEELKYVYKADGSSELRELECLVLSQFGCSTSVIEFFNILQYYQLFSESR